MEVKILRENFIRNKAESSIKGGEPPQISATTNTISFCIWSFFSSKRRMIRCSKIENLFSKYLVCLYIKKNVTLLLRCDLYRLLCPSAVRIYVCLLYVWHAACWAPIAPWSSCFLYNYTSLKYCSIIFFLFVHQKHCKLMPGLFNLMIIYISLTSYKVMVLLERPVPPRISAAYLGNHDVPGSIIYRIFNWSLFNLNSQFNSISI